ncbi:MULTISPECIES: tRNA glutamyl-Q(34) synthetase GluQRS [unclassified Neptuniibacter]|uniref:tRNA glutamyl-Q(34) synthetase GluQRS n=1 Tax=unclassified Neptuniibacter TaxID=2630693 RepID=UPI0025D0CD6B|nr:MULTISPECIES: tRNA glutamyl-Q(34) synthetase GluQRS [unclassified Neptuniibacter]
MTYIGRFAPSPTGPLHFGSLLAALASFLDARANNGKWLLRIENLDPPREQAGIKETFPNILEAHGLYWDDELCLQSDRHQHYQNVLDALLLQKHAYRCNCSRKEIISRCGNTVYDQHCLLSPPNTDAQCAIRINSKDAQISFTDLIQGQQNDRLNDYGDFVVYRRDNLYAYLLAVVVDDYLQGITHVVRGSDLLSETARQIHLQHILKHPTPTYAHIPVATNNEGQKLSKQTFAPALDIENPVSTLFQALKFLDQRPPQELLSASKEEVISWGINNWKISSIKKTMAKPLQVRT